MSIETKTMQIGRGIQKNILYNLAGNVLPLFVAFFTMPILIQGFGKEKFGILSLAWVLIGYFSLADFGLSRALTKFVSERIGQGRRSELPNLIWTALFLMTVLGIIGAICLALLSPIVVRSILKIESTDTKDVLNAFYILSVGVPITIASAGLRGILEAFMRFDLSNYVRLALGVLNFAGPALILTFSKNIISAILILIIGRVLSLLTYCWLCLSVLPELKSRIRIQVPQIGPLIRFGGWITISNIISPIMVSFDRFFIGSMVSVSALAYYSTPWEVVARLLIIPSSLAGVMFPVFSQSKNAARFHKSLRYVLLIMFPLCLICTAFAKEILSLWLGGDFALESFRVMQVMALAVFTNGLAMIPFALIQASGRPDITAKFHLIEVLIYIPFLYLLIKSSGIVGAAISWLIRVTIDLILLLIYSGKLLMPEMEKNPHKEGEFKEGYLFFIISVSVMLIPVFVDNLTIRIFIVGVVLTVFIITSWNLLLEASERKVIGALLSRKAE
jgi:O-antigen/teichoic acid export membrane protein